MNKKTTSKLVLEINNNKENKVKNLNERIMEEIKTVKNSQKQSELIKLAKIRSN